MMETKITIGGIRLEYVQRMNKAEQKGMLKAFLGVQYAALCNVAVKMLYRTVFPMSVCRFVENRWEQDSQDAAALSWRSVVVPKGWVAASYQ